MPYASYIRGIYLVPLCRVSRHMLGVQILCSLNEENLYDMNLSSFSSKTNMTYLFILMNNDTLLQKLMKLGMLYL